MQGETRADYIARRDAEHARQERHGAVISFVQRAEVEVAS